MLVVEWACVDDDLSEWDGPLVTCEKIRAGEPIRRKYFKKKQHQLFHLLGEASSLESYLVLAPMLGGSQKCKSVGKCQMQFYTSNDDTIVLE